MNIPAESSYGQVELDIIDNEPFGLLPRQQDTLYGQMRKVFADYAQAIVDQLTQWYYNLDPRTCDDTDIGRWEEQFGLPIAPTGVSLVQRRANVMARLQKGPFTRARRAAVVESFIIATFGPAIEFGVFGVPFVSGGIPFYSGEFDLTGLYAIVENIPAFSYQVRIKNTVTPDIPGLTRELNRITPAHLSFTIVSVAIP